MQGEGKSGEQYGEETISKKVKIGTIMQEEERATGRGRDYKKRLKSGQLCKEKERAGNSTGKRIKVKRLKAGKLCKERKSAEQEGGETICKKVKIGTIMQEEGKSAQQERGETISKRLYWDNYARGRKERATGRRRDYK